MTGARMKLSRVWPNIVTFFDDVVTCNKGFASSLYLIMANGAFWYCALKLDFYAHLSLLSVVSVALMFYDLLIRWVCSVLDGHATDSFRRSWGERSNTPAFLVVSLLKLVLLYPLWIVIIGFWKWLYRFWYERTGEYAACVACSLCQILLAMQMEQETVYLAYCTAMFLVALPALKKHAVFEYCVDTVIWVILGVRNLIVSAACGVVNLIIAILCAIRDAIFAVCDAIYRAVVAILKGIRAVIFGIANAIKRMVLAVVYGVQSVVLGIRDAILYVVNTVIYMVWSVYDWIRRSVIAIKTAIIDGTKFVYRTIRNAIVGACNAVVRTVLAIRDAIYATLNAIRNAFIAVVYGIRDAVVNTHRFIVDTIANIKYAIQQGFWYSVNAFVRNTIAACVATRDAIINSCVAVHDGVTNAYLATIGGIKSLYHGTLSALANAYHASVNTFFVLCSKTKLACYQFCQYLINNIINLFNRLKNYTHHCYMESKRWLKQTLHRVKCALIKFARETRDECCRLAHEAKLATVCFLYDCRIQFYAFCEDCKIRFIAWARLNILEPLRAQLDEARRQTVRFCGMQWVRFKRALYQHVGEPVLVFVVVSYENVKFVTYKTLHVIWACVYGELVRPAILYIWAKVPERAPYLDSDSEEEMKDFKLDDEALDERALYFLDQPLLAEDSDSELVEFAPRLSKNPGSSLGSTSVSSRTSETATEANNSLAGDAPDPGSRRYNSSLRKTWPAAALFAAAEVDSDDEFSEGLAAAMPSHEDLDLLDSEPVHYNAFKDGLPKLRTTQRNRPQLPVAWTAANVPADPVISTLPPQHLPIIAERSATPEEPADPTPVSEQPPDEISTFASSIERTEQNATVVALVDYDLKANASVQVPVESSGNNSDTTTQSIDGDLNGNSITAEGDSKLPGNEKLVEQNGFSKTEEDTLLDELADFEILDEDFL